MTNSNGNSRPLSPYRQHEALLQSLDDNVVRHEQQAPGTIHSTDQDVELLRRGLLASLQRLSCHIPTCVLREFIAMIQFEHDNPVVPIAELTLDLSNSNRDLLEGDQGGDRDLDSSVSSSSSDEYDEDLRDDDNDGTKKPKARRSSCITAASVLETLDNVAGMLGDCGLSDSDSNEDDSGSDDHLVSSNSDLHLSYTDDRDSSDDSSLGEMFGNDSFGPTPPARASAEHPTKMDAATKAIAQAAIAKVERELASAAPPMPTRGRPLPPRANTYDARTANHGLSQSTHLHCHDSNSDAKMPPRSRTPPPSGSPEAGVFWKNRLQGLSTRAKPASAAATSGSVPSSVASGNPEQCMTKLRQGRLNNRAIRRSDQPAGGAGEAPSIHGGSACGNSFQGNSSFHGGNDSYLFGPCSANNSVHSNSMHHAASISASYHSQLTPNMAPLAATWDKLETTRRASALLFVDISGFTKLSTVLDVESFSKIINTYFEKITCNIQSMGGDILKFAGDAIMAEWMPQSMDNMDDDECDHQHQNHAVLAASLCAAKLVEECSDFVVELPGDASENDGSTVGGQATLNIYCAVGFGVLVGTHVGDQDRMEYVVLGDPIQQVALGMQLAQQGEVVASKEAFQRLKYVADFVLPDASSQQNNTTKGSSLAIARKSQPFFQPRENEQGDPVFQCKALTSNVSIVDRDCGKWSMEMLSKLQQRLNPYAHPVVKADEMGESQRRSFNPTGGNTARRVSLGSKEKRQQSPSEVRDVCTVFLQPTSIAAEDLSGPNAGKEDIIDQLGQIMLIVNSEVTRVQAHLRQFIVDDKGLVIIASFGLRGSTFPNMIESRAMPCVTNIIKLLRSELDVECKIGVTYGKAFCGVVGGFRRHEYAILGRSVNLAARLMAHPENPGILVDELVKQKAGDRPFEILCPVKAKGYDQPVKIFRPEATASKTWVETGDDFVGRSAEVADLKDIASRILYQTNDGSSVMLLSASYGMGKSFLLSHCTQQIEKMCQDRRKQYHIFRHVCREDDSFLPFSLVMPLFQRLLGRRQIGKDISLQVEHVGNQAMNYDINELKSSQLYVSLLQTCMEARIPLQYIEVFAGLIFTDKLSDIGKWSDKATMMSKWDQIAHYLVKAYIHCTQEDALVVLALDDVSGLDELSWKIIHGLTTLASNILVITTARYELNVSPEVWDDLEIDIMQLAPMNQNDIFELTKKRLEGGSQSDSMGAIAHTVFLGSEGNPLMANKILHALYNVKGGENVPGQGREPVEELLLNRLDSLGPTVRRYLSLGALFGMNFQLSHIVSVKLRYHHIAEDERATFAATVGADLQEAAKLGYLETGMSEDNADISYTFSHPLWQEALSRQMLAEWRDTMTRLINEVLPGRIPASTTDSPQKSEPPISAINDSMDSSQTSDTQSEMTSSTAFTGAEDAVRRPSVITTSILGSPIGEEVIMDEYVPEIQVPQIPGQKVGPTMIEASKLRPPPAAVSSVPKVMIANKQMEGLFGDGSQRDQVPKAAQSNNEDRVVNVTAAKLRATQGQSPEELPSRVRNTIQKQNQALADDLRRILSSTNAADGGIQALESLQELIALLEG